MIYPRDPCPRPVRVTSPPRRTTVSGADSYRPAMTRQRGLLGCLVLIVAATALTACAEPEPFASPGVGYDKLVDQVYGTPAQRRAVEARAWWTSRLAAVECMRRAGHTYSIIGFNAPSDRDYIAPGELLAFAPARQDFDIADQLIRASSARHVLDSATRSVTNDDGSAEAGRASAVSRCEKEATAFAAAREPDGQQLLAEQLVGLLRQAQDSAVPNLAADYRTCMTSAGIPAVDLADLYDQVERAFPATLATVEGDPTTLPGWADAVAFEQHVASEDARCRKTAVETVRASVSPLLVEFAGQYAVELDRVAAGRALIEVDARSAETAAGPED